ncbi:YbhB/YbcL family Raf kinase inhibitor-like protein [Candidatus Altiarchaeota archaeon]
MRHTVFLMGFLLLAGCMGGSVPDDGGSAVKPPTTSRKSPATTSLEGPATTVYDEPTTPITEKPMMIASDAFPDGGSIPAKYTCDGDNVNPALTVEGIPANTRSLVLIVDDPDAPRGTWDHWLLFNIIPGEAIIDEGIPPKSGKTGINSFRRTSYGGPCPPTGEHRYYFRAYALDTVLDLPESSGRVEIESVMRSHVIAEAQLMGRYVRR